MGIHPPSETETLRLGLEQVRRRLPSDWKVEVPPTREPAPREGRARRDAIATLRAPEGRSATLDIEIKADGSPRATRLALGHFKTRPPRREPLLIAPYLPPRSRRMAEEAGVNYADLTGNLRLAVRRPALFIRDLGADVNPWSSGEVERSLGGSAAARLILWMCRTKTPVSPWLLTEAAGGSGVSLAYVSRLIRLLEREDLVRRDPRGPIREMDRPGIVRRWAEDYGLLRSNGARAYLDPRGARHALEVLGTPGFQRGQVGRIAVTGSFAANRYAPVAAPSKLACYVEDFEATARALDLTPSPAGGNVFLLAPYDGIVFEAEHEELGTPGGGRVPMAPPAQIAVDCLTGPDRMPEEGEALLAWLEKSFPAWKGFVRGANP